MFLQLVNRVVLCLIIFKIFMAKSALNIRILLYLVFCESKTEVLHKLGFRKVARLLVSLFV